MLYLHSKKYKKYIKLFETGSHVVQDDLKLNVAKDELELILLLLHPYCWNYRCISPYLIFYLILFVFFMRQGFSV